MLIKPLDEQIFDIARSGERAWSSSIRTWRSQMNESMNAKSKHQRDKKVKKKKRKKRDGLLLFGFVIDKNGGSKSPAADLLHDLVLIHTRFHSLSISSIWVNELPLPAKTQLEIKVCKQSGRSSFQYYPLHWWKLKRFEKRKVGSWDRRG